jgi:hypothetical protein
MLLEVWLESPLQYVWNKLLCMNIGTLKQRVEIDYMEHGVDYVY